MNWSLQYADGTRPSEFKPMDEETKTWLKEALDSMIVDDVQVLKKGSEVLALLEDGSDDLRVKKENAAELILSSIENLDCALNLVKLDGLKHVIRCMIGSTYPSVRKLCASIFTSAVQNNPSVQKNAVEHNAVEGLCERIAVETDLGLKEQYTSCVSGLVRGEFGEARQKFVEIGGLEILNGLLTGFESARIVKKCLLMLSDIFYNTRSKGDERVVEICRELGVMNTLEGLKGNDDQEILEMVEWAKHNGTAPLQA
jgi:hypothetical protein